MISIESPGKIVKCGCPSKILAAASCDSALTTVNAPMLLLVSSIPRSVTLFVLPNGPPMTTMAFRCLSTHAFQAAMPSRSCARRSLSGRASQAARRGLVLLPKNTARYVLFVLMVSPHLRWAQGSASNDYDEADRRKSTGVAE